MSNKIKFLIVGIVSGFGCYVFATGSEVGLFWGPGFIFGLFLLLGGFSKTTVPMKFFWILGSGSAYFFALKVYFSEIFLPPLDFLNFAVAGVAGAFIMLFFFHSLLSKLTVVQFIILTLLGGVLALSMLTPLLTGKPAELAGIVYLFPIWQGGMAFALGWTLDIHSKQISTS